MIHDVLKANKVWAEYEAEGAALQSKRASLAKHELAVLRPYREASAAYPGLVQKALDSGDPPPPRPTEPDTEHLGDARRLLEGQEQAHRTRKDGVLAAASEDLLAGLHDRERADNAELATLAPKVRRLLARRREDLRLAADVYGAVDRRSGQVAHPSRSQRVRRDLDTDRLLAAAEADVTLLDPEPVMVAPNRQPRIMADDGNGWMARMRQSGGEAVGYTVGGRFGGEKSRAGAPVSNRGVEI